jgi:hypothetical protein
MIGECVGRSKVSGNLDIEVAVCSHSIAKHTTLHYSRPARIPNTYSCGPLAPWIPSLSKSKSPVIYSFSYWLISY